MEKVFNFLQTFSKKNRHFFYDGRYIFFSSVTEKLSFFIMFVILAGSFQAEAFGMILVIFAFSNIMLGLTEFGFGNYLHRKAAADPSNMIDDLHITLSFKVIFLLLLLPLSFFYFSASGSDYLYLIPVISISVSVLSINSLLSKILYGGGEYRGAFISLAASRVLMVSAGLLLMQTGNINYLVLPFLLSAGLQLMLLISFLKLKGINAGLKFNTKRLKAILRSSLPMGLGVLFVWFYDKADILLIEQILGASFTANYSVAYSFYKVPQIFSAVLLVPLFTRLCGAHPVDYTQLYRTLKKYITLLLVISLACILACLIASQEMISLLYGNSYTHVSGILNLIIFALPGLLLNNLTGVVLNSLYKEKFVMFSTLAGLIVNILCNVLFLNNLGIKAAVLATISGEYLVFIIQMWCILLICSNRKRSSFRSAS